MDNFNLFYKQNKSKLISFLSTKSRDKLLIEEVVQDAFLLYLKYYKEEKGSPVSFLFTIALNQLYMSYKKDKLKYTLIEEYNNFKLEDNPIEYDYDLDNRINDLNQIIDTLPKIHKDIFKMKLDGFKLKEIALKLNLELYDVKNIYYSTCKKIKSGKINFNSDNKFIS